MDGDRAQNLLKVCCTCAYWSYRYKGYCHRLEQGVGKFWICEEWLAASEEAGKSLFGASGEQQNALPRS